ncbi:MAG: hypothetical protein PVF47_02480 [Anaerolineae bacterium]
MRVLRLLLLASLLVPLTAGCGSPEPTAPPTAVAAASTTAVVQTPTPPPTERPTEIPTLPPTETATDTPQPSPTLVPTLPAPTATDEPTPEAAGMPSTELLKTWERIEFEMEMLRGLDETTPITRTLMTPEELVAYLEREFEEEYPPQEIKNDVRVLAAFDFVPEDYDLRQVLLDLYASEVLGFYEDEEDTFYVVNTGEFDLLDEMTFAHEYVHGLQDQAFDLETFIDEDELDDDAALARLALVEGDASLAMTEYLMRHIYELSDEELASLGEEEVAASEAAMNAAPAILRETLLFPYTYGSEFVTVLQVEGWEAVDAAFADPPQSTEQILHPEKYLTRDEPELVSLPPLTDTLGAGWERIESENLGEFQIGLYLAQQVDRATAEAAAAGWDGDRYAVYVHGDDEVLAFATVWDSETDRDEFVAAYEGYAEAKYQQPASRSEDDQMWWQGEGQVTVLRWDETGVLLVVGPDVTVVEQVLGAF